MPHYIATVKILFEDMESADQCIGKLSKILTIDNCIDFGYLRVGKGRCFPRLVDAGDYILLRNRNAKVHDEDGRCPVCDCKVREGENCLRCEDDAEDKFDAL